MKLRRGERVGKFTLVGQIGSGGNSVVWGASCSDGPDVAIKVLTRENPEGRSRFQAEVSALTSLAGLPGVMPVLESHVGESKVERDRWWYAMPVGVPIRDELGPGAEVVDVVNAIASIAASLASVHARGFVHRDIKPDNLFRVNDDWVLGDFGLVTFPGKPAVTEDGGKLGPIGFLAPELLNTPSIVADARPSDVYALAKTLWVLLTGDEWPPQGPFRLDEPPLLQTTLRGEPKAGLVDRLLVSMTHHNPASRPSAENVAKELIAWSEPVPAVRAARVVALGRELSAKYEVAEAAEQSDQRRLNEIRNAANAFHQGVLRPTELALVQAGVPHASLKGTDEFTLGRRPRVWAQEMPANSSYMRLYKWAGEPAFSKVPRQFYGLNVPHGRPAYGVRRLYVACFHRIAEDEIYLKVGHHIFEEGFDGADGDYELVWDDEAVTGLGQPAFEHAVARLSQGIQNNLETALERLLGRTTP